jgi:predicted ribosomally synthesized peptide with SipW-like signal peptide
MAKSRKVLTAGAVGVAALALIGAGASATFTASTSSNQTVTAGTAKVVLTSPDVAGCTLVSDGCTSLTMPTVGPVGSTFQSIHRSITATNAGTVATESAKFSMSETHVNAANNNALLAQTNVCIQSTDYTGGPWTEGNGPLTAAIALGVNQNPVHLLPGNSIVYSVDFYAGMDSTQCNPKHSDGSLNRAAWDAFLGGAYTKPASLTNAAQGGVINTTFTYSVTG